MPDAATLQSLIAQHPHWYHRIEVAPGIVTPGVHDSPSMLAHLDQLGLPKQGTGLRVLDIGCRDGFFSFELEKRGAEVIGIDYVSPTQTGFAIASELLHSHVTYLTENVYALSPERHGMFDLVLFLGVLYHLRNPLLALDTLHRLCKPGAWLFAETQLLDNCFLLADGTITSLAQAAPGLEHIPLMQFYPNRTFLNDPTNKWAPNMACLRQMLEEAQFEIVAEMIYASRGYCVARAIADPRLENYKQLDSGRTALGQQLQLQFDQAPLGSGWHPPTLLAEHGATCWTGPETRSTLNISLTLDRDLTIRFRVLMALAPDILDSLKLSVNDQPIPLSHHTDPVGATIFEGRLPPATLQPSSSLTRLVFEVNRTLAPSEVDAQNPDERPLGVLFNWIEISPWIDSPPAVEADPISSPRKNSLIGSSLTRLRRLATRISRLPPKGDAE
jgi:tRNA (mo5U34)-methyltransferase